jgi:hypothetical protein
MTWLTVIGMVRACIIGVWKFFKRIKSEKRKLADEAKAKLDKANSPDGSASDFLDAFGRARRV